MAVFLFFFLLSHIASSAIISSPKVSNASGDYFIASKVSFMGTHFPGNTISCPISSTCHIICDKPNGCKGTTIWASQSTSLTIDCVSPSSCSNAVLQNGPTDSLAIRCTESSSCASAVFKFNTTTTATIDCRYTDTNTSHDHSSATCGQASFYGMRTVNATVRCDAMDCVSSFFHFNSSSTATFIMSKPSGPNNQQTHTTLVSIYAPNITKSLTVQCVDPNACDNNTVVCPSEADCNFECADGSACRDFNIYVENKHYNRLYLGVTNSTSLSGTFRCMDTGDKATIEYQADRRQLGCAIGGSQGGQCCPLWNTLGAETIVCDPGTDCEIDCEETQGAAVGTCDDKVIDASDAKSLTVRSGSNCVAARIICPKSEGVSCNILCDGPFACEYTRVDLYDLDLLNISCTAQGACVGMEIWPPQREDPVVRSASLQCTESRSCESLIFGYRVYIDEMDIQCNDYRSCFNVQFPITKGDTGETIATTVDTALQLNCSALHACSLMYTNILTNWNSSAQINVMCRNRMNVTAYSGACHNAFFEFATAEDESETRTDFKIGCGRFDCQEMQFNARTQSLSVDCYGEGACRNAIFRTASVDELEVQCTQDGACRDTTIYQKEADILCGRADRVCYGMTLVSMEGVHDVQLTCASPEDGGYTLPCDKVTFECAINSKYDTYLDYNYVTHSYDGCVQNDSIVDPGDNCCPPVIRQLASPTTPPTSPVTTTTAIISSTSSTGTATTGATGTALPVTTGSTQSQSVIVSEGTGSTTQSNESKESDSSPSSKDTMTIIFIVAGAVVGALFVGFVVWCLVCRKKKKYSLLLDDAYDESVGNVNKYVPPNEQEITTL